MIDLDGLAFKLGRKREAKGRLSTVVRIGRNWVKALLVEVGEKRLERTVDPGYGALEEVTAVVVAGICTTSAAWEYTLHYCCRRTLEGYS